MLDRFEVVRRIGSGSYGYCQFAKRRGSLSDSSDQSVISNGNVVLKQLSRDRDGNEEVFKSEFLF